MENDKQSKFSELLKNMSDYSVEQPKVIEDLCKELYVSPAYSPAMDLMVEAFLSIRSFCLLMFDGLISNASAILRILIEQVAAITVIARNTKAMSEYLKFQTIKKQYFGSDGEEHEKIREYLINESGNKYKSESALKDYLDYGWIRVLNNDKSKRGDRLIIKEAHLEEMIADINEQLNAFAHGQRSMFEFIRHKDLADKHVSRIIMIAGKLFLFLCNAKRELLINEDMPTDKHFKYYLNAKILFLDLNARSVNASIVDVAKMTNNLDRNIVYSLSTLDHMRGLMYQSELNYVQVNFVARAYVFNLINFMFMICYKLFNQKGDFLNGVNTFQDLINKVGIEKIDQYYKNPNSCIPLDRLIEMIDLIDDNWRPMKSDGQMANLDEMFMTDFASLVHSLFEAAYPNIDVDELLRSFIPIN